MNLRILHIPYETQPEIRLQRYIQSNINMGIQPFVLCIKPDQNSKAKNNGFVVPDADKVSIEYYKKSKLMFYSLPIIYDEIGLKKFFIENKCDLVHAHSPQTAYYSYKLGLPTVFDDWEYWLEFLNIFNGVKSDSKVRMAVNPRSYLLNTKRKKINKIVRDLIKNVPLIVTNEEVERKYRELGASSIVSVPNVPLKYERDYAFAVEKKKLDVTTTCYIASAGLDGDATNYLRNTGGIKELWEKENLGNLISFGGQNYVGHMELLRKIKECHFNLLFWKPLNEHRYYLQNKPFLASIVGVPTIISSSLKATIDLLGDYALPVNSINEIPELIRGYDYSKKYALNPAHLWEYYESRIKTAYEDTLKTV
jgi:hypothetical protein